jgi:hypothetical protein
MRDKTEPSAPENSENSLPFFARFLEGQETEKGPDHTLKFPSDSDEWVQRVDYTTD